MTLDSIPRDPTPETPLGQVAHWWLYTSRRRLKPNTIRVYEGLIRIHLVPVLGKRPIGKIGVADVEMLLADMEELDYSPSTIALTLQVLRQTLQRSRDIGALDRNVANLVAAPSKTTQSVAHPLTVEDARKLLEYVTSERYPSKKVGRRGMGPYHGSPVDVAIVLALTCGLRMGEIMGLRGEDVELESGRLLVRHQVIVKSKRQMRLADLKSRNARRLIHLPPIAQESVEYHIRNHLGGELDPKRFLLENRREPYMWPELEVWTPYSGSYIRRKFYRFLRELKMPRTRFHDLRHTFASAQINAGVPAGVISKALGHANFSITNDYYGHLSDTGRRLSADTVQSLFAGEPTGPAPENQSRRYKRDHG